MTTRTRGALVATAALAMALSACGKKEETGAPTKTDTPSPAPAQQAKVRQPNAPKTVPQVPAGGTPGSQPAAAPGSQPAAKPAAGSQPAMPAGHPPKGAMPAGHPPTGAAGSQPAGAQGPVKGTIKLDDTVKAGVTAGKTLFIIVRKDAGEGQKGSLLAAKKIAVTGADQFPLEFEITSTDLMFPGSALAGSLRISARVDADGDAISKTSGDVIGKAAKPVMAGGSGVEVLLDGKIP
ncbi:MAG: hypothetical protein ACE366_09060 [Bradymonadia bacterium]